MKMTWKKGKGLGKEEEVVDQNNRKYIKITTKGESWTSEAISLHFRYFYSLLFAKSARARSRDFPLPSLRIADLIWTNEVGRYNITWLFKMAEGAELGFAKTKKSKSYHLDLERPASKIMTVGNKCFRFVLTNFPNITRWKRNGVEVPHRSNRLQKTPSMYASIGWRLAKITCNFR